MGGKGIVLRQSVGPVAQPRGAHRHRPQHGQRRQPASACSTARLDHAEDGAS
jgi:hypothetical protein